MKHLYFVETALKSEVRLGCNFGINKIKPIFTVIIAIESFAVTTMTGPHIQSDGRGNPRNGESANTRSRYVCGIYAFWFLCKYALCFFFVCALSPRSYIKMPCACTPLEGKAEACVVCHVCAHTRVHFIYFSKFSNVTRRMWNVTP